MRLSVLLQSIHPRWIYLIGFERLLLFTRKLCGSVLRHIERIVISYWRIRWLLEPIAANFGKTRKPVLIGLRRFLTARWYLLVPLTVHAPDYLTLRRGPTRQLQLRSEDCEKIVDLRYRLDGAVRKE